MLLWFLVTQQSSALIEKVFLALSLVFLVYIPAAFIHTDWGSVLHATVQPNIMTSGAYIGTVVALVGTTISPYMQFFVQSAVAEKGAPVRDYTYTRAGVISGSIFAIMVAAFIIIACAGTIYLSTNRNIQSAGDAARCAPSGAARRESLATGGGMIRPSEGSVISPWAFDRAATCATALRPPTIALSCEMISTASTTDAGIRV